MVELLRVPHRNWIHPYTSSSSYLRPIAHPAEGWAKRLVQHSASTYIRIVRAAFDQIAIRPIYRN
jgi:hypothetical protein